MPLIKKAGPADLPAILHILDEAELIYPGEPTDDFFVAIENGEVAGIARLEQHSGFNFLSSLGVSLAFRHRRIAGALVNHLTQMNQQPTYLYTIIPDFFSGLGFTPSPAPPSLPPRETFGCHECEPGRCLCMVKSNGDPPLS